jgi:hypothetical protein
LKGDTCIPSNTSNSTLTLLPDADNMSVGNDLVDDTVEPDELSLQQPLRLKEMFTKNLSLFFLKLLAQQLIPESVVDVIACELKSVNATNQQYLDQNILLVLTSCGVDSKCIESVMKSVHESDLIKFCLDDGGILSSSHKRLMYIQHQFHYVNPEPIYVGVNSKNKVRYCHYIPVKKSLQALLSDTSVLYQCTNSRFACGDILSDFTDGSVYKNCVASVGAPDKCLSLILYQDSFEIANPLGSAKTRYKVLGFYYVLGNLESSNRSATDHIQLVLLALETDVAKVGQRIFRRLVDDLKELESIGLEVSGCRFKVVVPAIAGDNLGSHWLGGFTTSFSNGPHSCRYCTITNKQLRKGHLSATYSQLRTVESYSESLRKLSAEDLIVHDGVRYNSIFNNLASFHVCNPGLPPCVAHDLFEGVVSYDLPLFLKALVKEQIGSNHLNKLSVPVLNNRLLGFNYLGCDALVKPPQLKKGLKRLSGSATQNWCLLCIIPLLIADLTDNESDVYQALLLLRSVCELIMAPSISLGQVAEMKVLIEDYIERRSCLFPDVRIRPKHHYLMHYAQLTLQFGPLVKLWTMRFEAKHQYFKRCIRSSKNFLNVTSLLANRHQLYQAYLSSSDRFASDVVVSSADIFIESSIVSEVKRVLIAAGVQPGQVFSSAAIKGTVYKRGLVLPFTTCYSKKTIVFGEILVVVSQDCGIKLVVGCRNAVLDFETGCYNLDEKHDTAILSLQSFADYHPLPVYTYKGRSTVVLHHQFVDRE